MAKILSNLNAPRSVYAVLGNHDWWFDAERVQQSLESLDIPVLEDASIDVSFGGCELSRFLHDLRFRF